MGTRWLAMGSCLGCMLAASAGQIQGQTPTDLALGEAVTGFLDSWLIKKQSAVAVEKYLSTRIDDESLIPASAFGVVEYDKKFPAGVAGVSRHPVPNREVAVRMTRYLQQLLPESWSPKNLADVLAPIDSTTDPQVWEAVQARDLRPAKLVGLPAYWIKVSRWEDYSWTASATPGHQWLLPDLVRKQDLDLRGTICRIRPPNATKGKSALTFLLWAHEPSPAGKTWKLWGVVPVPTE